MSLIYRLVHQHMQWCILPSSVTLLSAGSASQQQSTTLESQTESSANGAHEQMQQAQQQFDNQQYAEADWAAYWQYYGKSPVAAEPAHACAYDLSMWYLYR